ncbi:hypothetical protein QBC44DRAFT_360343 [Cladorrhinum sp. PSN332]|nr:hypothetical protein QBC44DRAFT_360343 [Cladorrhinum sp. PSN332]
MISDALPEASLGEGATSTVRRVRGELNNGLDYLGKATNVPVAAIRAVKIQPSNKVDGSDLRPNLLRRLRTVIFEIQVLSHPVVANHRNIVSVLGFSFIPNLPLGAECWSLVPEIALEFASLGSARKFLTQDTKTPDVKASICLDVAAGLEFLHACGIVHGDVKLDNVLVFPADGRSLPVAKISDIELSPQNPAFGPAPQYMGTEAYNAPEVQDRMLRVPIRDLWRCDVFAFGLLVLEVLVGVDFYWNAAPNGSALLQQVKRQRTKAPHSTALDSALQILDHSMKADLESHLSTCGRLILNTTLQECPMDRLPTGWPEIHRILSHEVSSINGNDQASHSLPLFSSPISASLGGDEKDLYYSVLRMLSSTASLAGENGLATSIWSELELSAATAPTSQQRGEAKFHLFLCATTTEFTPDQLACTEDAIAFLTSAADDGYIPASIVGKRVFQANDLPVPPVFSGPSLFGPSPDDGYYSTAVRTFWPQHQRSRVQQYSELRTALQSATLESIEHDFHSMGPSKFQNYANTHRLVHCAILIGDHGACDRLLELGANVNSKLRSGITPLSLSCRLAEFGMARLLLRYNANPCLLDEADSSPFHWLIMTSPEDTADILSLMLRNLACSDSPDRSRRDVSTVKSYAYFDPLVLKAQGTALDWAILSQHATLVAELLRTGLFRLEEPRAFVECLRTAAGTTCAETVAAVGRYAKHGTLTRRLMMWALNSVGADKHSSSDPYRWIAHGPRHQESYRTTINALLDVFGLPPDTHFSMFDSMGAGTAGTMTPLAYAVSSYNVSMMTELVRRGSDPNCEYVEQKPLDTPLSWAISQSFKTGYKACAGIKTLWNLGGTKITSGTPILAAIKYQAGTYLQELRILQLITELSPGDINTRNEFGDTPLQALIGREELSLEMIPKVKLFVEAGADVTLEDLVPAAGFCNGHVHCRHRFRQMIHVRAERELLAKTLSPGTVLKDLADRAFHKYIPFYTPLRRLWKKPRRIRSSGSPTVKEDPNVSTSGREATPNRSGSAADSGLYWHMNWMEEGETAVVAALQLNRWDAAMYLLNNGAPLEYGPAAVDNRHTVLHFLVYRVFLISWGAKSGHIEDILPLLRNLVLYADDKRGFNLIMSKSSQGITPMHLAILFGLPMVVTALLGIWAKSSTLSLDRKVIEFGSNPYGTLLDPDSFAPYFGRHGNRIVCRVDRDPTPSVKRGDYLQRLREVKEICDSVLAERTLHPRLEGI